MKSTMKVLFVLAALFCVSVAKDGVFTFNQKGWKESRNNSTQQKIHIIYMNHLDVGYNGINPTVGFINNVLNKYFQVYFPRAIKVAHDLKVMGYDETFIYTTHPWLVSMYMDCPLHLVLAGVKLQCPNVTEKAQFVKAVRAGIITWHAGPMNMQIENMDQNLLNIGLRMSQSLDDNFGIQRSTRVLSQRDVPGMTSAVIPHLVKSGITGVSVGVNEMTPPPAVPNPFVWKFGNDEVVGTWHKGGYPDNPGKDPDHPGGLSRKDCTIVEGLPDVLCFAFRSDNLGPPMDYKEVLGYYEILRHQFPGATYSASTFEAYFTALLPFKHKLPVVTSEIGDTWIQGIASDPRKMAEYRAVARVFANCTGMGQCLYTDNRVWNASRFLIKLPEHTWGLPSVGDTGNWSNPEFYKNRHEKNFQNCEASWREQREFTYLTIQALRNHPVVPKMLEELAAIKPSEPDLSGYKQMELKDMNVDCPQQVAFTIGVEGYIKNLLYAGVVWFINETTPLGKFQYFTYDEKDFDTFGKQYNYNGNSAGFYKRNVTASAHPESREWPIGTQQIFRKADMSCDVIVHLKPLMAKSWIWYGAPQDIWVHYKGREPGKAPGIDITLQIFDKTTTRLPEALFFTFTPLKEYHSNFNWRVWKVANMIDPMNVILNGSQLQHGVQRGVCLTNHTHSMQFTSLDVALACPVLRHGAPTPFPAPLHPLTQDIAGFSYNLYNNIWETNWIFWYPYMEGDQDFKARFSVTFEGFR